MVCEGGKPLLRKWMRQVAELRAKHGVEVIWVTSGAIAWAAAETKFKPGRKGRTLPQKQALSSIGQPLVQAEYNSALRAVRARGSQVLLTAGDMQDRDRRKNLQNTLNELLNWKVLPILNENDAVATAEIQFGDNDALASQVAVMMKASRLILMTDVNGLFDADPNTVKDAHLIRYLPEVAASELRLANPLVKSTLGTGGMYSKLLAAQRASRAGIVTHMVRGDLPAGLLSIARGVSVGTQIGGKFKV
jgi:glutamate 5-kinase